MTRNRDFRKRMLVALCLILCGLMIPAEGWPQKPRYKTTADPRDYEVNPGGKSASYRQRLPKNYDYYYYRPENGYVLNPNLYAPQYRQSRVLGPVKRYTDVEYGRVMETLLDSTKIVPSSAVSENVVSVVDLATKAVTESGEARPVEVKVLDVLDRGILFIETREQVRLRGIRIPSEKSNDDVLRLYSREAAKRIRQAVSDKPVYLFLDEPVRGSDGLILASVFLHDGTDLNRLLIVEGLGQVEEADFDPLVTIQELHEAEQMAKNSRVGLWSRKF